MRRKKIFLCVTLVLVVVGAMTYRAEEVAEKTESLKIPDQRLSRPTIEKKNVISSSVFVALDDNEAAQWDKKKAADDLISRARIGSLGQFDTDDVAEIHRGLTLWLLVRLELLSEDKNRDQIRIAVQEIADRYYLLDRVVKIHKMQEPGSSSILKEEEEKVNELIQKMWKNPDLWMTVDETFQKNGLLRHEHVVYMLRHWMTMPD